MLRDRRGFGGNIELQIVVAIIGILAAILIPKCAEALREEVEAAGRANLEAFRDALAAFRADSNGRYPYHPASLLFGKRYLAAIPPARIPNYHSDSTAIRMGAGAADVNDAGGWLYVGDPSSKERGTLLVNCTHIDTKGRSWTSY